MKARLVAALRSDAAALLGSAMACVILWKGCFLERAYFHDLLPTYIAGELLLEGRWDSIYVPEAWDPTLPLDPAWQSAITRHGHPTLSSSYVYHPFYLLVWLPAVALLPLPAFLWLHLFLNGLALAYLSRVSLAWAGVNARGAVLLATLAAATLYPVVQAARLGQNVVIATAVFLLGIRWLERGRSVVGGALLLAATTAKPWLLLLVGALPFRGWWRQALAVGGGYVLLLVALPRLVLPAALRADFREQLGVLARSSILAFNNLSIRAVLLRLRSADWPRGAFSWQRHRVAPGDWALELAVVAVLGALAALLLLRRRGHAAVIPCAMAFALLPLGVLWNHYLVVALPVLVYALLAPSQRPVLRALAALALLSFWIDAGAACRWLLGHGWGGALLPLIELPLVLALSTAAALLWVSPSDGAGSRGSARP